MWTGPPSWVLNLHIINTSDVNKTWNQIKDTVRQSEKMILGIKKNGKKPWFNKACEDSVQRRKVIRKYWLKDINNEARAREFSRRKKETHSIIRVKKRKYLLRIIEDAGPNFRLNRTLDTY